MLADSDKSIKMVTKLKAHKHNSNKHLFVVDLPEQFFGHKFTVFDSKSQSEHFKFPSHVWTTSFYLRHWNTLLKGIKTWGSNPPKVCSLSYICVWFSTGFKDLQSSWFAGVMYHMKAALGLHINLFISSLQCILMLKLNMSLAQQGYKIHEYSKIRYHGKNVDVKTLIVSVVNLKKYFPPKIKTIYLI